MDGRAETGTRREAKSNPEKKSNGSEGGRQCPLLPDSQLAPHALVGALSSRARISPDRERAHPRAGESFAFGGL
jgi:hypothetical protein